MIHNKPFYLNMIVNIWPLDTKATVYEDFDNIYLKVNI